MRRTEVILDLLLIILILMTVILGYYQTARVGILVGQSMEPTMTDGDITIYEPHSEAAVGDIIVFTSEESNGELVAHRVIHKNESHYITKGDNNTAVDDPIARSSHQYKGKVVYHITVPAESPIPQEVFVENKFL